MGSDRDKPAVSSAPLWCIYIMLVAIAYMLQSRLDRIADALEDTNAAQQEPDDGE